MNQTRKEKLHHAASVLVRNMLKIFWLFPVKDTRIMFISHAGTQYSCNPKYISQYLEAHFPGKFERIFALREPEKWSGDGEKFVKFLSPRFMYDCCTARVIVSNCGMLTYLPKRKGQYVINTWHGGGAYKRNMNNSEDPGVTKARLAMELYKSSRTDLVLSSSEVFSRYALPDLVMEYQGEIMPCGMPRNDIVCDGNHAQIRRKVCDTLGVDSHSKLVLYAPTFRGNFDTVNIRTKDSYEPELDVEALLITVLKSRQNASEPVLMIRAHHAMNLSVRERSRNVIDVTGYPDTQELLCAADMLISDYSSIIWDYALTRKPCFLFVPDKDYYINEDRGTYTPMETWPGILCETNEELARAVQNFDEAAYRARIDRYLRDMGSYETGTACEQVCRRIAEVCGVRE